MFFALKKKIFSKFFKDASKIGLPSQGNHEYKNVYLISSKKTYPISSLVELIISMVMTTYMYIKGSLNGATTERLTTERLTTEQLTSEQLTTEPLTTEQLSD